MTNSDNENKVPSTEAVLKIFEEIKAVLNNHAKVIQIQNKKIEELEKAIKILQENNYNEGDDIEELIYE